MNQIPEFTILSKEQCFGRKRLKLFDEVGIIAEALVPCEKSKRSNGLHSAYWTKSHYNIDDIIIVDYDGEEFSAYPDDCSIGCRLAIDFDEKYLPICDIDYLSSNVTEFKLEHFNHSITWLKHKDDNVAVTKKIIFAGIPYNRTNYCDCFEKSYLKQFIDENYTRPFLESIKNSISISNESTNINNSVPFVYNSAHLRDDDRKYGIYLTDKNYDDNPAVGRDREIRLLSKSLLLPKKGVVLVGDSGVGKTAIVEGLAYQIKNGNVCDLLKNKGILSVNVHELLAGCQYRGNFEEKIKKLCDELEKARDVILFLDEMHTAIGAGTGDGQNIDMANMLKPYISNEKIKVIGCTTRVEYERYFGVDKAFRRRFKIVDVLEPNLVILQNILVSTMNVLSNKFKIKINLNDIELNDIIKKIIHFSSRTGKYTYEALKNPDASISILSDCFTYFAVENKQNVVYKDFIDGIIDNDTLNLSQMEIDNCLLNELNLEENECEDDINRTKIISLNTKKYGGY